VRSIIRSVAGLAIAGTLAAACGAAASPSVPPSAAGVTAAAAAFDAVAAHFATAWSSGDAETMRGLYTEDVHLVSGTMEWNGIEEMVALAKSQSGGAGEFSVRVLDTYLGRDGGLVVDEATYAANDPRVDLELHVFTTRGDRIATWELLIDPARTHDYRYAEVDAALLDAYATAWSSGDPKAVAALYAESASREDSLFVDDAVGRTAIADAATRLFGPIGDAARAREPHNNRCLRRSASRAWDCRPYAAEAPPTPKARAPPLRHAPAGVVLTKRMCFAADAQKTS
jgi:ketosteroid isomerase-like protein